MYMCFPVAKSFCEKARGVEDPPLLNILLQGVEASTLSRKPASQKAVGVRITLIRLDRSVNRASDGLL